MRFVAFILFGCAAFNWTPPYLDRAGTAALAFGFVALTVGAGVPGVRRALPFSVAPSTATVADDSVAEVMSLADRLAAYDG